eukprot:TRINITY_DN32693_c0_g1_i1.p1 TRINITY_DN32693_c0_g1~~TRINITY_DN32693_c0_g1_i1.p1  ORF type:complete len:469 (+),score=110.94 TRINITY_DN32693_c0_g1_i1:2-1408(+)
MLDAEGMATCAISLSKVGLHSAVLPAALQLFTSASSCTAIRRSLQDFSSIVEYFSAKEWQTLQDASASSQVKQHVIIERALVLGLRCPREPTLKLLSSLHALVTEGEAKVAQSDLLLRFKSFKKAFKDQANAIADPHSYIALLPKCPSEYRAAYPAMYALAYTDQQPMRMPIALDSIMKVDASYKCRRGSLSEAPAAVGSVPNGACASNPMTSMMQFMMQGFQQMQQAQMKQQAQMFSRLTGQDLSDDGVTLTFAGRSRRPHAMQLPGIAANGTAQLDGGANAELLDVAADGTSALPALADAPVMETKPPHEREPLSLKVTAKPAMAAPASLDDVMIKFAGRPVKKTAAVDDGETMPGVEAEGAACCFASLPCKSKGKTTTSKGKTTKSKGKKATSKSKATTTTKAPAATTSKKAATPSWSHVNTRECVEARSGQKGPGSAKVFKWAAFGGKKGAETAAAAWCKARAL